MNSLNSLNQNIWEVLLTEIIHVDDFESIRMVSRSINQSIKQYLDRSYIIKKGGRKHKILLNGLYHGPYEIHRDEHNGKDGNFEETGHYYWGVRHGDFHEDHESYLDPHDRIFERIGQYWLGSKHDIWYTNSRYENHLMHDIIIEYYHYDFLFHRNYFKSLLNFDDVFVESNSLISIPGKRLIISLNPFCAKGHICLDDDGTEIILESGHMFEHNGQLFLNGGYLKVPFGVNGSEIFCEVTPFNLQKLSIDC